MKAHGSHAFLFLSVWSGKLWEFLSFGEGRDDRVLECWWPRAEITGVMLGLGQVFLLMHVQIFAAQYLANSIFWTRSLVSYLQFKSLYAVKASFQVAMCELCSGFIFSVGLLICDTGLRAQCLRWGVYVAIQERWWICYTHFWLHDVLSSEPLDRDLWALSCLQLLKECWPSSFRLKMHFSLTEGQVGSMERELGRYLGARVSKRQQYPARPQDAAKEDNCSWTQQTAFHAPST